MPTKKRSTTLKGIEKAPTGIKGLDEITYGGLPKGRPILVCGNTGCGKTLLALEILIKGAIEFKEPGVFLAFEESKADIIKNIASLGFDLKDLENKKLIYIDYVDVDTSAYETGEYDLQGLFIRIENSINKIGAKRLVIDTLEVLFSGFQNEALLRAELRRLFDWIKEKQITAIITGEQGSGTKLTRYGIEEYVADCVISLTNSLNEDLYTRRLQIVKYRGSYHETNRFPFVIGKHGILLLPITSLELNSLASTKRISTGIPALDGSLEGKGYYQGSSILISGSSGAGKTTFGAAFAKSVCSKKQTCLFISYEQSETEIMRNLTSIGLDFKDCHQKGFFKIISARPTQWGLEKHLGKFIEIIEDFHPDAVIIDPISSLSHCGSTSQVYGTLLKMVDFLKIQNITLLMTIIQSKDKEENGFYGISSIIDTWIHLRNEQNNGELTRDLLIIKSRGMQHSNQLQEFTLSHKGINIKPPYFGESGVLTGTARIVQENKDILGHADNLHRLKKLQEEIELKKRLIEIQIEGLNTEFIYEKRKAEEEKELLYLKDKVHKTIKEDLKKIRDSDKKVLRKVEGAHGKSKKR